MTYACQGREKNWKLVHICQSYYISSTVKWQQFIVDGTTLGGISDTDFHKVVLLCISSEMEVFITVHTTLPGKSSGKRIMYIGSH